VLPPEAAEAARVLEQLGVPLPVRSEGFALMGANWRYSSAKALRELRYRARPLDRTLSDTIDWYRELIESGRLGGGAPSPLSLSALGVRAADRLGLLRPLRAAEGRFGRRLVAP
jgi:hypothetical protein